MNDRCTERSPPQGEGLNRYESRCVNDTALFHSIGHPEGNRTGTRTVARLVGTHVTGGKKHINRHTHWSKSTACLAESKKGRGGGVRLQVKKNQNKSKEEVHLWCSHID